MNAKEYAGHIERLDNYPKDKSLALYALGLCGEASELSHAITDDRKEDVAKELGDVCWYALRMTDGISGFTGMDADEVVELAKKMYSIPEGDKSVQPSEVMDNACACAEIIKKLYRDCVGVVPRESGLALIGTIVKILYCVISIAEAISKTIEEVFDINIEKLLSREQRGVLAGGGKVLSGDNR